MTEVISPDFVRGIMISLCALVVGALIAGLVQAYRQRYLPAPRRTSLKVVMLFVTGYLLLIMQVGVDRWMSIGDAAGSPATLLSVFALIVNFLALVLMVKEKGHDPYFIRSVETREKEHRSAVKSFKRAMDALHRLNVENWKEAHPGVAMPEPIRYQDDLRKMPEDKLEEMLKKVNGEEE